MFYMEHFEQKALQSASLKPKVWFRYVDDTFVVWPQPQPTLAPFLDHLNGIHQAIQFTMEEEVENRISFLVRRSENKLTTTVFQKATHRSIPPLPVPPPSQYPLRCSRGPQTTSSQHVWTRRPGGRTEEPGLNIPNEWLPKRSYSAYLKSSPNENEMERIRRHWGMLKTRRPRQRKRKQRTARYRLCACHM